MDDQEKTKAKFLALDAKINNFHMLILNNQHILTPSQTLRYKQGIEKLRQNMKEIDNELYEKYMKSDLE